MTSLFLDSYATYFIPLLLLIGMSFIQSDIVYKKFSYLGFIFYTIGWIFFYYKATVYKQFFILITFLIYGVFTLMIISQINRNRDLYFWFRILHSFLWVFMIWCLVDGDFYSRKTQYITISGVIIVVCVNLLFPRQRKIGNLYDVGLGLYSIAWCMLAMITIETV